MKKNKRALSEVVSYVFLIVIALTLAGLIYAWLVNYLPSTNPNETCKEGTSLAIEDYSCSTINSTIEITIKNQGMFSISGFFIRASNSSDEKVIPTMMLNCSGCPYPGRWEFFEKLKPQEKKILTFGYENTKPLSRIQIQPYIISNKTDKLVLCESVITTAIDECN